MRRDLGVALRQEDVNAVLRFWTVAVVICGLLLGLDRLGVLASVRGAVEKRLWPIEQRLFEARRTVRQPIEAVFQGFSRYERIAALEEQLALAAVDQQKLKQLEAQVEFQQNEYKANTLAELYVKDELSVVGAGEVNGIVQGMAVTDKHGVLVGRIESVSRYVSRVERVGSIDFKIPAQTVSGSAKGVVFFDGSAVVFGEVLQSEPLAVGEIVVTGGAGGQLPARLVIGQITAIAGDEADVTKKGIVQLLFQQEGWVAIW